MSYRATPNTTTDNSPFYLLHEREIALTNNDDLKAKLPKETSDQEQRL
jgi:hypothetical protein